MSQTARSPRSRVVFADSSSFANMPAVPRLGLVQDGGGQGGRFL